MSEPSPSASAQAWLSWAATAAAGATIIGIPWPTAPAVRSDAMPAFRRLAQGPDARQPMARSAEDHQASRGNRRRLLVFAGVFAASLLAGQAWNYTRPDEFRTSLRLQLGLPDVGVAGAAGASSTALANQLQTLNSRPLLEKLVHTLAAAGRPLPGSTDDAVARLQAMLQVQPVAGADVVALTATGTTPALLADVLNTLPEVIRGELVASQARVADARLADARQELARLDKAAGDRRAQLERFRSTAGLQAEREENEAVAQSKGLSVALNNAVEKEATLAARLRALEDSVAAGRVQSLARDDPTLASLENRASVVREELRDMERVYTPDFMAMDPQARAKRARLTELERQITQQRQVGQQTTLQAARDDLASARAAVERLRGQQAAARPALRGESTRFGQAKQLEDDLVQVEKARRETLERVARLDADERRREPTLTVLEAANVPVAPFRPDHGRDSLWVLGASFLLGLLAMGLVELFNRAPRIMPATPTTTVVMPPQPWAPGLALLPGVAAGTAGWSALPASPGAAPTLAAPVAAPAILQQAEAAALLAAAQGPTRWLCALALLGMTAHELASAREADVDPDGRRLQVRGAWARALTLPDWLARALPQPTAADRPLLHDAAGQALDEADLQTLLACASLDAGLPQAAGLQLEDLRNTCVEWLVAQGLRFSDLPARVGRIDAERVAAFARPDGAAPRRAAHEVEALMPALRLPPPA